MFTDVSFCVHVYLHVHKGPHFIVSVLRVSNQNGVSGLMSL